MTGQVPLPPAQLLIYRIRAGRQFEGQLVGALERIESGGALRVLDVLFVQSDAETGDLDAVGLRGSRARWDCRATARLPNGSRRATPATERVLSDDSIGIPEEQLRELGKVLEPGAAMAAVLVEHAWPCP